MVLRPMDDQHRNDGVVPYGETPSSRRRDSDTGLVESAGFLGEPDRARFIFTHRPSGSPQLGFIVCPPFLGDFAANYRREVVFARRLSASGLPVWRFHYPGTGNSDGSWLDASFDDLRQCAEEMARHMVGVVGEIPIGMVGTRMSSFVAAACVAHQPPEAPLILWDPVIDPRSHFRQAFRAEAMRNVKEKRPDSPSVSDMMSMMAETGSVDVLGYSLPFSIYQQTLALDLVELLRGRPRPVLVVSMGAASRKVNELVQALQTRGFDVTSTVADTEESWWFDSSDEIESGAVVDATMDWLSRGRIPS